MANKKWKQQLLPPTIQMKQVLKWHFDKNQTFPVTCNTSQTYTRMNNMQLNQSFVQPIANLNYSVIKIPMWYVRYSLCFNYGII